MMPDSNWNALEEGDLLQLDFGKLRQVADSGGRVLPAVVQDADSGRVLLLAYVNEEALLESKRRGVAVFWSTSRQELWVKGDSSGDFLDLVEICVNCEQNSLLYRVRPRSEHGGVCHTRDASGRTRTSCYYRRVGTDSSLEPASGPSSPHPPES